MLAKPNPVYEEEQTAIWSGAYLEITEALATLKLLHSASARLKLLDQIHENVAIRNNRWQERKIRSCFSSALGRLPRSNPIDKIEVDGQIISDKTKLAEHLVKFFKAWFGDGLSHWTLDSDGNPSHPAALDDPRGVALRMAI